MMNRAESMTAWNSVFLVVPACAGSGFKINDELLIVYLLDNK